MSADVLDDSDAGDAAYAASTAADGDIISVEGRVVRSLGSLPVLHDTFTLTRVYAGTPAQLFAMFAEAERWRRWFRLPGRDATYQHDFRVGGGEVASSTFSVPGMDGASRPTVERLAYRSHIIAIEPGRRLVTTYAATVDDVLRWTSLVTIELEAQPAGRGADPARTLLRWTEQVAFLAPSGGDDGDGSDDLAHVRGGTQLQLNALGAALAQDGFA